MSKFQAEPQPNMKIEEGKVVVFRHSMYTPVHGNWSTFEIEILYPQDLRPELVKSLLGQDVGFEIKSFVTEYENWVYDPKLLYKVKRQNLATHIEIKKGMVFQGATKGSGFVGYIKEVHDDYVLMDCNPPFSGYKNVTEHIKVLAIREPERTELEAGFKTKRRVIES